jgi:hypothetical protein
MSDPECEFPLIVHRASNRYECIDGDCSLGIEDHIEHIPCQWSWPYAQGRTHAGRRFPNDRCAQCRHIRRSGHPEIDLIVETQANG